MMEYNVSSSTWGAAPWCYQHQDAARRSNTCEVSCAMPEVYQQLSLLVSEIPLTKGLVALVDADLHPILSRYLWQADSGGYARRTAGRSAGATRSQIWMHREVLRLHGIGIPPGLVPDHRNRNRADNRLENLRFLDRSTQNRNQRLRCTNTSGYRGVSWHEASGKWRAVLRVHNKDHYLGIYSTPEAAFAAYEQARASMGLLSADDAPAPLVPVSDAASLARPHMITNTSGYRGVTWDKRKSAWKAQFEISGTCHNLGYYATSEEASIVYQEAFQRQIKDLQRQGGGRKR